MPIIRICLLSMMVLSFSASAQSLYKWVDKDGKVHYSDEPPPKEIKKVEQPRLRAGSIDTSGLPYETQRAAQNFPVTLFTTTDCGNPCEQARDFLARRGTPYSEKSLANAEDIAAFKGVFGGENPQVPAMLVGSQKQQGFEATAWSGILDMAGYPKTAIPGSRTTPAPAVQ